MELKSVNINDIKPYEKNPRKNDESVKYVVNSIKEFGFKVPIVLDKKNVIVCGHTRYKAAMEIGMTEIPCIYADDLTDKQIKAFRLADNKVGEYSFWDDDLLGGELSELLDFDMTDFGFEDALEELDDLTEAEEDDYELEVPEEPKSRLGQIYQLGRHKLMCGDSTKKENIRSLCGGGTTIDLLITDPPYNVDYVGKTKDALKIANDHMENDAFRQFLVDAFSSADEVMKPGAAFYIWHADSEGYNFLGACKDVGWTVRQCLIWNKNSMVIGRQDYQWKHEPCLYGWKEGAGHKWTSDRKQTTVIDMQRPTKADIHPTMKPIPLFDYQIKNNSRKGDAILDLFGGSGTTIMACEQNGRNAYVMEFDPKYVDAIIKRWETFTGQKAVLISEGNCDET